jgi:hypothetical protein
MGRRIEERLAAVRDRAPGSREIFRLVETKFDWIEPSRAAAPEGFLFSTPPPNRLTPAEAGRETRIPGPGLAQKRGARRRERRAIVSRGPPMAERTTRFAMAARP